MLDNSLSVYYQNCRGIRTKLNILYMNILSNCYDIIILIETWLTPHIFDNEYIDERYVVFRCDRNRSATNKKEGGGVLVAVRKTLNAVCIPYAVNPHIEHVLLQITGLCRQKYHIGATYIPPNSSEETYLTHFENLHTTLDELRSSKFHLYGDYNLPNIEWLSRENDTSKALYCNGSSSICRHLGNFMSVLNAFQFNNFKNSKGRILDLIISNNDCHVYTPPSILLPIDSHHPPFCSSFSYTSELSFARAKICK